VTPAQSRYAVPGRITVALDARGLKGPDVDEACGVAEPVVDLWEAGVLLPSREQVQAVASLTGFPAETFYRRDLVPAGRMFVCGRRKEFRTVVEAGEVGPPQCPRCKKVCWMRAASKTGGEVLLDGPSVNGSLIMCVAEFHPRRKRNRMIWGVRRAGKAEQSETHLLRSPHACSGGAVSSDGDLFSSAG
jgi:hypothetical protein